MAADAISPVPVALGSATSDTEEGRAFFQERLGLYAMWIFHQLHIIQTNRVAAFRMLSEADVRAEHLMVAAALPPPV